MSEERGPEPMGSGSESSSAGDSSEQPIGAESEAASAGAAPEQQMGTEISASDQGTQPEPDTPEAKDGSRVGGFLKRALRWVVLMLVIFTLGVVAMEFVRVRPLRAEQDSLRQSLAEAEATQQDLQAQIDRLEGVEAENQALAESLQQTEARLALLNILVDVTRSQLALAQDDMVRVAAALQGTGEKLSSLRDLLGPAASNELEGLRERLVLVLSEVDGDPFAAERDLEILANTLLEIEQGLSGE